MQYLIEMFESKIEIDSDLGKGCSFSFTIKFKNRCNEEPKLISNTPSQLLLEPINVLLIEDNKINQVVTKKMIEVSNMSCTIVDDGFAALVALERESFDIVLMDINMPLINGFDTSRKIREKGITIPIIALTAFDKQEVAEQAISAGMNDVLMKPFESSMLFQVIQNQVNKRETAN